jgi:DNA-binding CsgD family transcriptional regulator
MKKYDLENGGIQEYFGDTKKEEIAYYDKSVKQLEENTLNLYTRATAPKLQTQDTLLLQRQLSQAISHVIYAIRNDKFEFLAQPHLRPLLHKKRIDSIRDLRNGLEIVEQKLDSANVKYNPMSNDLHQQIEEVKQLSIVVDQPNNPASSQDITEDAGNMENERDQKLIKLLAEGQTQKEVAAQLHMSLSNIKTILSQLRLKYDCSNTSNLISHFMKNGF